MTTPIAIHFADMQTDDLTDRSGRIALLIGADGKLDAGARKVNALTRKSVDRALASDVWAKLKAGEAMTLGWPAGLAAEAVVLVKLERNADAVTARKAGGALAGNGDLLIFAGPSKVAAEVALGVALRGYACTEHNSKDTPEPGRVEMRVSKPEDVARAAQPLAAVAEGVVFARDLVNAPANVLTTENYAARLEAMQELGLEVDVLDEPQLEQLGMRLLLSVGHGSDSPSKVVIMRWMGGGDEAPLALVGKGVVFDTGGISLKPAAGMEEMTMDMGGSATVAGVMRTLALRKAKANVVGIVGLVENMPSARATRPGDIVTSMKGDTVEIINTDAEGRLVLADIMWHVQQEYKPRAMVDLATLTGAMLIALGHEMAGVFSNDDDLVAAIDKAAAAEGEPIWRLPLAPAYDDLLKSRLADMKNIGGRPAGSITAAQFLQRFVQDGTPWMHMDIAGVASSGKDRDLSVKGATGWGVMALNRWIADQENG